MRNFSDVSFHYRGICSVFSISRNYSDDNCRRKFHQNSIVKPANVELAREILFLAKK